MDRQGKDPTWPGLAGGDYQGYPCEGRCCDLHLERITAEEGFCPEGEIKYALEFAEELPEDAIFIIPVRLTELKDSEIPQQLRRLQWVNLFEPRGFEELMRALRAVADQFGIIVTPITPGAVLPESLRRRSAEIQKPGHAVPAKVIDIRLHTARRSEAPLPLPPPPSRPPYHLSLESVLPAEAIEAIIKSRSLVFHTAGNAGGVKRRDPRSPRPQ